MSETGDPHTLGLKVTNFGPIVEAEIDLRPLTVFVGPSNTGKSYLAILIYALHSLFAGHLGSPQRLFLAGRDRSHDPDIAIETIDRLRKWLEELPDKPDTDSPTGASPLPPDIADLVRDAMRHRYSLGGALRTELARCFGVGSEAVRLIRAGSRSGSRILVGHGQASDGAAAPPIQHEFSMRRGQRQQPNSRPQLL